MIQLIKEPFFITTLLSGLLVAVLCGYLGLFIHLKKVIFISIALSEIAALGIVLGIIFGFEPTLASIVLTMIGVFLLSTENFLKNYSKESVVGFIYVLCISMAIILISKNPAIEAGHTDFASGNLLYSTWTDVMWIGVVGGIIMLIHIIFGKYFFYISFDSLSAASVGIKIYFYDLLLYLTLGMAISVSMKISGVLFVFASLVMPVMCGLVFAKNIKSIAIISFLVSVLSVVLGIVISYFFDFPTSPTIVIIYCLFFGVFSIIKKLF